MFGEIKGKKCTRKFAVFQHSEQHPYYFFFFFQTIKQKVICGLPVEIIVNLSSFHSEPNCAGSSWHRKLSHQQPAKWSDESPINSHECPMKFILNALNHDDFPILVHLSGASRATLSCSLRPFARSLSSQTSSLSPLILTSCIKTAETFLMDRYVLRTLFYLSNSIITLNWSNLTQSYNQNKLILIHLNILT